MDKSSRPWSIHAYISIWGTQRPVSVKYLFGEVNIAYSSPLIEDDLKFLDDSSIHVLFSKLI